MCMIMLGLLKRRINMSIQFHHKRNYEPVITDDMLLKIEVHPRGGETVAMESLQAWFVESLSVGDVFTKRLGKSKCSLDDNFNKKTGRELAQSRMKPMEFTVVSKNLFGTTTILIVKDLLGNEYTLCSKAGTKISHLIEYNIG